MPGDGIYKRTHARTNELAILGPRSVQKTQRITNGEIVELDK
jgi:hypothetical protein